MGAKKLVTLVALYCLLFLPAYSQKIIISQGGNDCGVSGMCVLEVIDDGKEILTTTFYGIPKFEDNPNSDHCDIIVTERLDFTLPLANGHFGWIRYQYDERSAHYIASAEKSSVPSYAEKAEGPRNNKKDTDFAGLLGVLLIGLLISIGLVFYFLPTIIAAFNPACLNTISVFITRIAS